VLVPDDCPPVPVPGWVPVLAALPLPGLLPASSPAVPGSVLPVRGCCRYQFASWQLIPRHPIPTHVVVVARGTAVSHRGSAPFCAVSGCGPRGYLAWESSSYQSVSRSNTTMLFFCFMGVAIATIKGPVIEGSTWTSTCSHVKCSLEDDPAFSGSNSDKMIKVHHHNRERYGNKHVCSGGLHKSGKCGCDCFGEGLLR
jgi:hypothetical protein